MEAEEEVAIHEVRPGCGHLKRLQSSVYELEIETASVQSEDQILREKVRFQEIGDKCQVTVGPCQGDRGRN